MTDDRLKVFLLDIESSPVLGYTYQKYEANIIGVKEDSFLLSFAYKQLGDKKVKAYSLMDFRKKGVHDDKALAMMLWEVFDKADVIIAHNGNRFDIKKSNTYFIKNGLTPPSPFKSVDTLQAAKRHFSFFGNSLDDLARFFKLEGKIETDKGLWRKCVDGNKAAFKQLVRYNKHDVVLLEQIYLKLLPFIANHPHLDPSQALSCPNCGSYHLNRRGYNRSIKGQTPKLQCQGCFHWTVGELEKY